LWNFEPKDDSVDENNRAFRRYLTSIEINQDNSGWKTNSKVCHANATLRLLEKCVLPTINKDSKELAGLVDGRTHKIIEEIEKVKKGYTGNIVKVLDTDWSKECPPNRTEDTCILLEGVLTDLAAPGVHAELEVTTTYECSNCKRKWGKEERDRRDMTRTKLALPLEGKSVKEGLAKILEKESMTVERNGKDTPVGHCENCKEKGITNEKYNIQTGIKTKTDEMPEVLLFQVQRLIRKGNDTIKSN
jgi:hypothetical protein